MQPVDNLPPPVSDLDIFVSEAALLQHNFCDIFFIDSLVADFQLHRRPAYRLVPGIPKFLCKRSININNSVVFCVCKHHNGRNSIDDFIEILKHGMLCGYVLDYAVGASDAFP